MCGIFGFLNYVSPKTRKEILSRLVSGLKRLEYRGYDSAGVVIDGPDEIPVIIKKQGQVSNLEQAIEEMAATLFMNEALDTHVAIAHTRWATHGPPCDRNAHPHTSGEGHEFVVVHNGMITNYDVLKKMLVGEGFVFESDTDTEVIAKLCKRIYDEARANNKSPSFPELLNDVTAELHGAYALLVKSTHFPGELAACRAGSPLTLGFTPPPGPMASPHSRGARSVDSAPTSNCSSLRGMNCHEGCPEFYFASDPAALVGFVTSIVHLEDGDIVHCADGQLMYYVMPHLSKGHEGHGGQLRTKNPTVMKLQLKLEQIMKGEFPHFMLKEIYEQPESLVNTMRGRVPMTNESLAKLCGGRPGDNPEDMMARIRLGGVTNHIDEIRRGRRLLMFACGTSYHSAMATRIVLEELTSIPVQLELASDFQDRAAPIFRDDVCCFISQSGETKDTIDALEYCMQKGALCVGFTNTVGSYISRRTHCGVHLNCGPEIGVASTKAYTSQVLTLLMFGLVISEDRLSTRRRREHIIRGMRMLSDDVKETLDTCVESVKQVAEEYKDSRSMLLMGRGYELATCYEGALKIKELAYIHSEGIHTGELKHGPLALVDEELPVIMVCTDDMKYFGEQSEKLYVRVKTSLTQVKSRKGRPIVITNTDDEDVQRDAHRVIRVPRVLDCLQPIINIIPLQLMSYHLATLRGHDVDKPRNLAKSVTVN
jgi:glucosamine--fructose-6-phosphate aminotransferase (isomerizing)